MKNSFILLVALLCSSLMFANDVYFNQITLPKNYKAVKTFSGDLSETKTFHLIFTRNIETRNYEILSYLFDGATTEKLPNIINKKPYDIISFHQKNNVLSLLLSYQVKKKSFVKKIDYNLKTNHKTESDSSSHEDFLTSIRVKDKSILIYKNDSFFKVSSYVGNNANLDKNISLKENADVEQFFKNKSVTAIKTDEFVINGATNAVKLYYENNTLYFTRDSDEPLNINIVGILINNKKANITQLLKFDLKTSNLSPKFFTFENANGEKFKKATSFFTKDKLFQLALSKKVGFINISDVHTGKNLNKISLNSSLSNHIKGNPNFQGIEKFLKNAGKNRYNATITANKTTSDKIRVRVDYVDIGYNYNYNWWWHHQQFMMHQQMHMQNVQQNLPRGFGPRIVQDYFFDIATVSEDKRFFELIIDIDGILLDEELPKTIHKEIDKSDYINQLEEIGKNKLKSSVFLKNNFRFIAYDRKNKKFIIQTNQIK